MPYLTNLPLLGGLSILAVAGGVTLGRATIDQVNPVYFQAPTGHFYADLAANRPSGSAPVETADDYVQPDYAYASTPYCVGCTSGSVEYRPAPLEPLPDMTPVRAPEAYVETVVVEDRVVERRTADHPSVDRYTSFRTAAAAPAPADPPAPADEPDPAQDMAAPVQADF